MNPNNDIILIESAQPVKQPPNKRFVRSLEYEVIANLTVKQYEQNGAPDFRQLLAIPLLDRIPGLISGYGMKRTYRMIKMLLQEFCYAIALPKSKKLSETGISGCTCDIILTAYEDQLSLEDLMLFFERAKRGKYGSFRNMLTHYSIMQKLEQYRNDRHKAYAALKEEKEAELKSRGPQERSCPEPTSIRHLFDQADASLIPLKNIG